MPFQDPYDNRIGNGGLPQGIWGSANRAYTRAVQPNELVETNLNRITDQNSAYLQQARNQAMAGAAARGLGNSSYAAGNAQAAAIRAAMPMAQQDATAYSNANTENLQWLNQRAMSDNQNSASLQSASMGAASQLEAARLAQQGQLQRQREQLAYEGEQAGLGRSFNEYMAGLNQGYGLQNLAAQNYYNAQNWGRNIYGNTIGSVLSTVLQSPDYFGNPDAAFGALSGMSGYIGNMLGDYFGQNGYFGG